MERQLPTMSERETGLAAIAAIRRSLRDRPRLPNPFRCDHPTGDTCPICGTDTAVPDAARHLRSA